MGRMGAEDPLKAPGSQLSATVVAWRDVGYGISKIAASSPN